MCPEGIYCCGPASVKAIKNGNVNLKFDTPFVFAEVNADYVSWLLYKDGTKKQIGVNHRLIGSKISTKAVGSDEREDITHNYKYAEGAKEEREVFAKAKMKDKLVEEPQRKLILNLKVTEGIMNGADFEVVAVLKNQISVVRKYRLAMLAQTILYNGQPIQECGILRQIKIAIGPHEEKRIPLQILYSNYFRTLGETNQILILAMVKDDVAKETYFTRRVITLQNPSLQIKVIITEEFGW
ncbi:hypothetical protein scyTo_0003987 [Scyliorhinus torazame]|uniref:Transglutaminase C-terminal domain-containing protein n=1 Tax=Scyliorhinus torazame TaxID=75743 RepID=A0A401NIM2_SCYTO|nr:hypothetical protein [Scyliorhinus torazame]